MPVKSSPTWRDVLPFCRDGDEAGFLLDIIEVQNGRGMHRALARINDHRIGPYVLGQVFEVVSC